jgi:oligopeptide/dipeptide ABC transporter ATP-binding protein
LATPLHPYTRMLLACHPDRGAALAGIPGTVCSPLRPATGCRFHPRCPSANPECKNGLPPRTGHANHQDVQCVLYRAEAEA